MGRMASPVARRNDIVRELAERGSVEVQALAAAFNVAQMTIRRDLEALEGEGLLRRIHGGAVATDRVTYEFSFLEKEGRNIEAKRRIAAACAARVTSEDVVFLDSGSTTLAIARALRGRAPRMIVTHNLCVVGEFLYQREVRVLLPGGELNPLSPDVFGELTCEALGRISVDVAFLGADAVDPQSGFYAPDLKSVSISRAASANAGRSILAADSSKFGLRSNFKVGEFSDLAMVVTDGGVSEGAVKRLEGCGLEVVRA